MINDKKKIPYFLFLLAITLLFIIASMSPNSVSGDVTDQVLSIQQWLRGESISPNFLSTPNSHDLSADLQNWIIWHAPGVPIVYSPLIATGLPLGITTRLTGFILYISGGLGWLRFSDKIQISAITKLIISFILSIYSITIIQLNLFNSGEIIVFSIVPWLLIICLNTISRLRSNQIDTKYTYHISLGTLGLLFGSIYWLKYSGFLCSIGLLTYSVISILFFNHLFSLSERLWMSSYLTICTGMPVFILKALHKVLGGVDSALHLYKVGDWGFQSELSDGPGLLYSFFGSIGLGLLHRSVLIEFPLNQLHIEAEYYNFVKASIGIPFAALIIYATVYICKRNIFNKNIILLWLCFTYIPFILLAYITWYVGQYNLLIIPIYRYTSSIFAFTLLIFLETLNHEISANTSKPVDLIRSGWLKLSAAAIVIFSLILNSLSLILFFTSKTAANFSRWNLAGPEQVDSGSSAINLKGLVHYLESMPCHDKECVIGLALKPIPPALKFELKYRTFDITNQSPSKFRTSKDMSLILITNTSLDQEVEELMKLKQRFPQSNRWVKRKPKVNLGSDITIWSTELEASKAKGTRRLIER